MDRPDREGDLHLLLLELAQGEGLKVPWLYGGNSRKIVTQISALFEGIECYVQCSHCGEKVSNTVKSSILEGLVVRAFVECVECVAKQPDAVKLERERIEEKGLDPDGIFERIRDLWIASSDDADWYIFLDKNEYNKLRKEIQVEWQALKEGK